MIAKIVTCALVFMFAFPAMVGIADMWISLFIDAPTGLIKWDYSGAKVFGAAVSFCVALFVLWFSVAVDIWDD